MSEFLITYIAAVIFAFMFGFIMGACMHGLIMNRSNTIWSVKFGLVFAGVAALLIPLSLLL